MNFRRCFFSSFLFLTILAAPLLFHASDAGVTAKAAATPDANSAAAKLVAAILGPSPMEENLRKLTDEIGGRVPGTEANRKGVAWGVDAFHSAGVDDVHTESFTMPVAWSEGRTRLEILAPVEISARVVSMAWSLPTPQGGIEAPLVDLGEGSENDFARVGNAVKGAFALIHTPVLRTWADLFAAYDSAAAVDERSLRAGAAATIWLSTRENGLLYRHMNTEHGELSQEPEVLIDREDGLRLARFIAAGRPVRARLDMPNRVGGPMQVENVIGEIRGSDKADEVVMLGAHLDSWELGSGALDNGCDAALVIEVARAIRAAGLHPRRTLRFTLWNGEEEGLLGSWAYARAHRGADLDRVVAYINFDGGTGHFTGFSTGGRTAVLPALREILKPLDSWGATRHTPGAAGGSDHVDFLLEGVPTLDLEQEEGNYITNYHASSDTFDKVDLFELRLHAAYAAVTMMGIADLDSRFDRRYTRAEMEAVIKQTGFDTYMKRNGIWPQWVSGERGRRP
jgi:Zn-dependent M28 family amino/carboxypeptidase